MGCAVPITGFMSELEPGAWVQIDYAVAGIQYPHDGIVSEVGEGGRVRIVHFCKPPGGGTGTRRVICETDLAVFLNGGERPRFVFPARRPFAAATVVARARSQIGAANYDLLGRNCQSFASWCCVGTAFSQEVHKYGMIGAAMGAVITVLSLALVAAARAPWSPA